MAKNNLPRGIRNNNPGNVELTGDKWQGLLPASQQTDGRFAQFSTPAWGIRALARTLITYQDKYNLRTIPKIINRWAPPVENNSNAYIGAVVSSTGISGSTLLDLHSYNNLRPIVEAIIHHENGNGPLATANTWYGEDVIDEALRLAGVVKPAAVVAKIPVTKETVGATATGALGAAQIAEVAPSVLAAIDNADTHLSSGSIIRVVVGLLTIAVAVYIAYSQVKKHESGVVA